MSRRKKEAEATEEVVKRKVKGTRFSATVTLYVSGIVNGDVTPEQLIRDHTQLIMESDGSGDIPAICVKEIVVIPKPSRVETSGLKEE